jgi:hypothetical protein
MRNQTRLYFLLFTVSLFLLGGCSTPASVSLSAENRNVIKRVQIDKNVAKPVASKYPPAKPGALVLLAPQRGKIVKRLKALVHIPNFS